MVSFSIQGRHACFCQDGVTMNGWLDMVRLSAMDSPAARPSRLRSSLTIPTPFRHSRSGVSLPFRSAIVTSPERTRSRAKRQRSSSVRPAPMTPAMPTTSPR